MTTSNAAFTVFPPAKVPRISVPNPHNRKPSLSKNLLASDNAAKESVIIKIEEHPVPEIPVKHIHDNDQKNRKTPSPESSKTLVSQSPPRVEKPTPAVPREYTPKEYKPKKDHGSPEPGSIGSTSTLVRTVTSEGVQKSPVVPIRSMFPVYNPSVPLANQNYYPQRPAASHVPVPTSKYSRQDLRTYMSAQPGQEAGTRTGLARTVDIPLDALGNREPQFSSPRALERLWEATHGTEPNSTIGSFDLEMARTSEAVFTFGPDPSTPFYTVTTYDTNEIAISKTCPRKRTVTCDVVLSSIESMERRVPPGDGLVTFIFPKMAAMLAINQSSSLAEDYGLAPTHRDEVQAAAMKRAASQEASHLRYNHLARRYELEHPAIARKQRDTNFIASPLSPQEKAHSVLHITVNKTAGQTSHGKPSITVTYPSTCRTPATSALDGVRLSTMGQSETDHSLASLDFHSNILHIDAYRILELMPSLFAIDSIVSAMISVAIADHNTNVVMGSMDLWLPPPKGLGSPSGSAMSWGTSSAFYATIAEREEAEAEAKVMQQQHKKDIKSNKRQSNKSDRSWFGRSKAPKQKQPKGTKQIVIGEFDLEKLGHYQGGSREGQELPAITRTILSIMIGGLKFVVWFLTMLVQMIAWILVSGTRCFTSEKF